MKSDSIWRPNAGLGSVNVRQARWSVIHVQLQNTNAKHLRSVVHAGASQQQRTGLVVNQAQAEKARLALSSVVGLPRPLATHG